MASPGPPWRLPAAGRRCSLLLGLWLCACVAPGMRADIPGATADEAWQGWAQAFDTAISDCVRDGGANCLPLAFAVPRPPAAAEPSAGDLLRRDLRTAEVLLAQKDAAALLARQYGIDARAYLGTGYSVPVAGPGAYDYEYATQREFFVPNLCGDPQHCARPDPDTWVWKLFPAEVTPWLDRRMRTFTRQVPPAFDAAGWMAAIAPAQDSTAPAADAGAALPLLVRFAIFPASAYRGMVGRPGTERVFFANYEALAGGTLRQALLGTGSQALIDLAAEKAPPGQSFFMWIHRPGPDSGVRPATWDALFDALEARRPADLALRRH